MEKLSKVKKSQISKGAQISDAVTETVGSWKFILIQSFLLALWIVLNVISWIKHWDEYPFILLNLALVSKLLMLLHSS